MESVTDYMDWAMDDIVFENRNKAYGSYQNKKAVTRNIIIGLTASMLGFVMLVFGMTIDWTSLGQIPEEKENMSARGSHSFKKVILPPPPPPAPVPPPPPAPPSARFIEIPPAPLHPPPPVRPSVRFTEMVIKEEPEMEEDESPAWMEEIKEQDISIVTNVGDSTITLVVRETPPPVVKEEMPVVDTTVYESVDQRPEFPGGDEALVSFIHSRIIYPEAERIQGVAGRVLVVFVVREDGSVSDARVAIGVSSGLNKEALRVVKMLPKFKPGRLQGRAVRVYFHIPVSFDLKTM